MSESTSEASAAQRAEGARSPRRPSSPSAAEAEATLLAAQQLAAIGRLTGGVAHDLNNAFAVILSFGALVREELMDDDPRRDDLDEVLRAADRGANLVQELRSLGHDHGGEKRPIDLNQSLIRLDSTLRRSLGSSIEFELTVSPRAAVVRMDPVLCDQLLIDLVGNGRDAMPAGGRLSLAIMHPAIACGRFPAGRYVRIIITDTGPGIDEMTLHCITEPGYARRPAGRGIGRGLFTCLAIVKDAQGQLGVDSAPGVGTTFTIDLPICDDPLDLLENVADGVQAPTGLGERVLVVDDDPSLRRLAARILGVAGYQVAAAANGDEAIRMLDAAKEPFDLVISDVVMPGQADGHAVVSHARGRSANTALLLTSGFLEESAIDIDAPPFLWKPYTSAGLLRAARSALAAGFACAPVPAAEPVITRTDRRPLVELVGGAGAAPMRSNDASAAASILLVAGDEGELEGFERTLSEAGYAVVMARDTQAAQGLLAQRSFDVVVSEIHPTAVDGMDLLRTLRARGVDTPVLLFTGAPSLETATAAIEGRAIGYLCKPFEMSRLVAEVERAVDASLVARVQRTMLAAHSSAGSQVMDIPGTQRCFTAALKGLRVVFQPIVRSHDGSIFGYEALLRSDEPTLCNPQRLLAAAEVLGRIDDVGRAVRGAVAATLASHPGRSEAIFVNLHPTELRSELLCAITEPLRASTRRVVLEITERASLAVGPRLLEDLRLLRAAGYRIAIDDLGEGYAGLACLAQLEPDIAKIDMSLIRDAPRSRLKREILSLVINVCRRGGITVVAEGIETLDEAQLLADLGCDLLQGYFFARPGPAFPDVASFVRRERHAG